MIKVLTVIGVLVVSVPAFAKDAAQIEATQKAYVDTLKALAHLRVEYQLCHDYITSTLRDMGDQIMDLGTKHNVLPRQRAIDIINDEQALRRVYTGRRCADARVGTKPVFEAWGRLNKLIFQE
jgi:competence protein ComGC